LLLCSGMLAMKMIERCLLRGQICDGFVGRCRVLPSCDEASEPSSMRELTSSFSQLSRETDAQLFIILLRLELDRFPTDPQLFTYLL
jgi:hypothetical protein